MAFADINRLVADRVPLDSVISKYVKLERTSRGFKGLCPFHQEKTASFHINTDTQFYYCFGCQAHGTAITFLMEIDGLSFMEAVNTLAEQYHIQEILDQKNDYSHENEEERKQIVFANKIAAQIFYRNLMSDKIALDYLDKRGVSQGMITKFGLGFAHGGDAFIADMKRDGVDLSAMEKAGLVRIGDDKKIKTFFYNRLMVPIIKASKVIGFGGRTLSDSGPKYVNSSDSLVFNKKRNIFALDFAKKELKRDPRIILTEGYFDVIALHQAGFLTATASLGTAITEEHLAMLASPKTSVILLLDGDSAGRKAVKRLLQVRMPDTLDLRVAFIPFEGADPDSVVKMEGGKKIISDLLDGARPLYQYFLEEQIEIFNTTDNIEEKVTVERRINEILDYIPPSKRRLYGDMISQKIIGNIAIKFVPRGNQTYQKPTEPRRQDDVSNKYFSQLSTYLSELFYIAAQKLPALIPSLQRFTHIAIESGQGERVEQLLQAADEGELSTIDDSSLDKNGRYAKKYDDMNEMNIATNFSVLSLKLEVAWYSYTRDKVSAVGTEQEVAQEMRRLTRKIESLKRELKEHQKR
ncbi:DNA primase [bacterium]|nr:DNA primase [bacterium]